MFKLKFKKSKSKNYLTVVKLADNFYDHKVVDETHVIKISVKELFEKWDYFNMLFWKIDKWIGTSFGYDNYDMCTGEDRKRLFYSLQLAHSEFLNLSVSYLRQIAPTYFEESFDAEIRERVFNGKDVDHMLDLLIAEKNRMKFKKEHQDG